MKIACITGIVRMAGKSVGNSINPRGVLIEVQGAPVTLLGLNADETDVCGTLIGKEITITVTTEESLPGVKG